jgi:hypothetical protein
MERSTGGTPFKIKRQIEKVRKAFDRGELFLPENESEKNKWWRAEARFMLGEYLDWSGWEYRDDWAATLWFNKPYPVKPWDGLKTGVLYIIGEQGIGDEVFFSSCLPECTKRANRVIVECMPRLQSILERSFGVETVPSNIIDGMRYKKDLPEGVTAWMSLGDLPRMWRLDLSHFPKEPFLKADIEQIRRFHDYRGCTGISWRGAQGSEMMIPNLFPDGLSLQYDKAWNEDGLEVKGLDVRNDIEGILGLLSNLDKVVTVSTSVAHFACALGIETHVIIANPKTSLKGNILPWKWVCKKTPGRTPWYPSARVYKDIDDFNLHYRSRCKP